MTKSETKELCRKLQSSLMKHYSYDFKKIGAKYS